MDFILNSSRRHFDPYQRRHWSDKSLDWIQDLRVTINSKEFNIEIEWILSKL